MTCPSGCVRLPGHTGFHTTHPGIAEREDKAKPTADSIVREAFAFARSRERYDAPLQSDFGEIRFIPAPWLPPGEAILANRDGGSAVRITGLKE